MSDHILHGSRRLAAIAEMAAEQLEKDGKLLDKRKQQGLVLADVGTDHAYLPIALCERKVVTRAIAADVNAGPLERAAGHIAEAGLTRQIEIRQSDGLCGIRPGEADIITICGMGGELVLSILAKGNEVAVAAGFLVLAPQSKLYEARRSLREYGYQILAEDLVCEDGKYYPILAVRAAGAGENGSGFAEDQGAGENGSGFAEDQDAGEKGSAREIYDRYGYHLIVEHNSVLREYLEQEEGRLRKIMESVEGKRAEEIALQLAHCRRAMQMMEER